MAWWVSPGGQSLVKSKCEEGRILPLPITDSELKKLMYSTSFVLHVKKMRVKAVKETACGHPDSLGQSRGRTQASTPSPMFHAQQHTVFPSILSFKTDNSLHLHLGSLTIQIPSGACQLWNEQKLEQGMGQTDCTTGLGRAKVMAMAWLPFPHLLHPRSTCTDPRVKTLDWRSPKEPAIFHRRKWKQVQPQSALRLRWEKRGIQTRHCPLPPSSGSCSFRTAKRSSY